MARDYKHTSTRSTVRLSGATGLALGLAIGLGIALAVYLYSQRRDTAVETEPVADKHATPKSTTETSDEPADKKYDFYDMLPKFEVVVPEKEKAEVSSTSPASIEKPGAYVLQAGSYRNIEDAERARAQLALQGIESKIQRVTIDSDTWHRIRIGPIENLKELNRTRVQLREADIEAIVIRVGE
jgi:cell division protein FtsN